LFLLPILSSGLYTKAKKRKILEFLARYSIHNWITALRKILGSVAFLGFILAPFLVYKIIIFSVTEPPIPPTIPLLAHLSLILFSTAILAWRMFFSSLTANRIIAAILTFALVVFLWLIDALGEGLDGV
jgi:ABC-2 type transport system permease protein